jgi:hypothetical protein
MPLEPMFSSYPLKRYEASGRDFLSGKIRGGSISETENRSCSAGNPAAPEKEVQRFETNREA